MRGLKNPSFILLDEGDFFPIGEQQAARDVSDRYIGKSNPYIVMISTPNAPGMLFDKINREPEDTCIYKLLRLDYTYGRYIRIGGTNLRNERLAECGCGRNGTIYQNGSDPHYWFCIIRIDTYINYVFLSTTGE